MQESRPKVLALYKAVLGLLDNGADINAMKVSDITRQAGIGKGTAYEYFKSKEEIIASALLYDVEQNVGQEMKELQHYQSFSEKIVYSFDWIERRFGERKSFARILRLTTQPSEISRTLLEELQRRKSSTCGPMMVLQKLCREAKEKGEIREDIPISAASIAAFASMASFAMYLEKREQAPDVEPAWMKEFLCNGLLKQLT